MEWEEIEMQSCPKCNEKAVPDGNFLVANNVKFVNEDKFLFFFKRRKTGTASLFYCCNCGWSAIQDIKIEN